MADTDSDTKPEADKGVASPKSKRLTDPVFEQEQRRLQVQREAKQAGSGSSDPNQVVNQDG